MSAAPLSYAAFKIASISAALIGAVFFTIDPTVKVAIIIAIPQVVVGLGTLVLGFVNRQATRELHQTTAQLEVRVDGRLTELLSAREKQAEVQSALSHAEGRREGLELDQAKKAPADPGAPKE